jgi:hypothetical protein
LLTKLMSDQALKDLVTRHLGQDVYERIRSAGEAEPPAPPS